MNKLKLFVIRCLVVLLALQSAVVAELIHLTPARADSVPAIKINELMWMGSSMGSQDQWIELYNADSTSVDLNGMTITNVVNGNSAYTFGSQVMAPGSYLLLTPGLASNQTILNPSAGMTSVVIPNFELSASCVPIGLYQLSSSVVTSVVDLVDCNGSSYYAGDAISKASMERINPNVAGTVSTNWQTSVQQVNIVNRPVVSAAVKNYGSPWAANIDVTAPTGSVWDGSTIGSDADITQDNTSLSANWQFTDPQSGIDHYQLAFSKEADCSSADVSPWRNVGLATSGNAILASIPLADGVYYTCVMAYNRQINQPSVMTKSYIVSRVISDGLVIDHNGSLISSLTLSDFAPDNGNRLDASWSTASYAAGHIDHFHLVLTGPSTTQTVDVSGGSSSYSFTGLTNATSYTATITAVDQQGNQSVAKTATATTHDELAPTIDQSKIVLTQNAPGTNDTISGSAGLSSEVATVNVLDNDPALGANVIGSVGTNADLSFSTIAIGDNAHAAVWLQLVDPSGNSSGAVKVSNDIVAPNAPTLNSVIATCPQNCQVQLQWQDNGPDTVKYQVSYTTNGVEQRTLDLTSTSTTLSLPAETSYDFAVYAFDAAGNISAKSNIIGFRLTRGVITTGSFQNGQTSIQTTAIPGAREVVRTAAHVTTPTATIQSPASVTNNVPAATTTPKTTAAAANTNSNNWPKILIVILLLLIIAAGFYLLSRSYRDEDEKTKPLARSVATPTKTRATKRARRSKK